YSIFFPARRSSDLQYLFFPSVFRLSLRGTVLTCCCWSTGFTLSLVDLKQKMNKELPITPKIRKVNTQPNCCPPNKLVNGSVKLLTINVPTRARLIRKTFKTER